MAPPAKTPCTALLVEDSGLFRGAMRRLLNQEFPQFEVLEAEDLASARRLIGERGPHVVLLDLHLPDGSGLDLLEAIRAVRPGARVGVCSSEGSAAGAALARGADRFVAKDPFDWEQWALLFSARCDP